MAPKAEQEYDDETGEELKRTGELSNSELMPNAGKVPLDPAMPWGRGIIHDIKSTVGTHWISEMINLNQKTIAVTLLIFISVIAPTLTFGAVYGKVTNNSIGAIETIIATGWVGVTYSLIGGMPLCIIGSTGPILIMTTTIYDMAENMDVPFLTFYAWISVWIAIYAFIAGFFNLTRYVKLATRFTDEIFATLIVSIFVMDAIGDPFSDVGILRFFDPNHPSHEEPAEENPDYDYLAVGLLSVVLGFGTTALIFFFRSFKFSSFFCNDGVRTSVHDFAVTLSVIVFTLIKEFLFESIETETLKVPDSIEPSFACCDASCTTSFPDDCEGQLEAYGTRDWFADMGNLNGKGWVPIAAAGPAILGFFLVYLDNGITWHLINHKSHNLQHGEAYDYDLVLNGLFNLVNGLLGLPWLVATTVPCMIHLSSLADKDKDGNFIRVQETRLTMLFSHALVLASMFALDILKLLPLPVLYGVFLFMGLSSLPGLQFWNRFLMFFMQPSKYPETPAVRFMEKSKIHKYTVFQILFFGLVFMVQNFKTISIAFPLMTLLCIPARLYLAPLFLENWEILLLDGENEDIEEWIELKNGTAIQADWGSDEKLQPTAEEDAE